MNLRSCTGVIPNCIPNLPVSIFFTIFDIPLHVKARLDTFPAGSITSDETEDMAVEFYTMCGGFLFLGIFLSLLFLLATVLIIYYKQVSEGYEDQRRYQIMQQVGMRPGEVALSIRGQILLVFFLPLLTAGLHILVAFPMICLYDTRLFALCTAGTLAMFAAVYAMVYGLTARTYERIVGGIG